ncbi:MAG: N-acetyltransferase [Calditrichaeota bacterium]|nr:MAG: N-acetyltransferase [Calditrichota bacterium]
MSIQIQPVQSAKEKKLFIDLEWQLEKNTPHWVSPLRMERAKVLDTKKNPFYHHSEIALFIARKNGLPVGRIAAIKNDNHNAFHKDKTGFWGFFECIDDQQAAKALFDAAADWLRQRGCDRMWGPMNPSTNDECGLLIDGFDTPPMLMMTHNPSFYPRLVESYGNYKVKDLYAWYQTTEDALARVNDKLKRVSEKVLKRYHISIRNMDVKHIDREVKLMKEVYNNAWSRNWGFVPFTEEEFDHAADGLKDIADPDFLLMAEKDGRPVGFSVTLPNLNEVLARIPDGRLLPTGIFKLLTGIKKIQTVRVLILGVIKEYQFSGLGSAFYLRTMEAAQKKGIIGGEMSWILEDNLTMNRAIESFGSRIYKTYRIYEYMLG